MALNTTSVTNDTPAQPLNLGNGIPTPTQTGGVLSPQGTGLLNQEFSQAQNSYGDTDVNNLMSGVGDYGLLKDTASGTSTGMDTGDFTAALEQRGQNAMGSTVNALRTAAQINEPVRIAQRQATAAADIAKNEQLRFNNWTLQETYNLQYAQLQSAQEQASNGILGAFLGLIPSAVRAFSGGGK